MLVIFLFCFKIKSLKTLKTKGIVLNQFKYSESSIIVNILTEEHGKMSFIVNGVRKKKSKFPANYFQAFNILQIVYLKSSKSDLHRIIEIDSDALLTDIIFDVYKSTMCMFLSEIINITHNSAEKDIKLFVFLEHLIQYIDAAPTQDIANIHIWTLLRLMQFNGISPENNFSESHAFFNPVEGNFTSNPEKNAYMYTNVQSLVIHQLLKSTIEGASNIQINRIERSELLKLMVQYFQLHIEGFRSTKSLDILAEIFE